MEELNDNSVVYQEMYRGASILRPSAHKLGEDIAYTIWRYDNHEITNRIDTEGSNNLVLGASIVNPTAFLTVLGESFFIPGPYSRLIKRQVDYDIDSGFATRRDTYLYTDAAPKRQESGKVSGKYTSSTVDSSTAVSTTVGKGL